MGALHDMVDTAVLGIASRRSRSANLTAWMLKTVFRKHGSGNDSMVLREAQVDHVAIVRCHTNEAQLYFP